MIRPRCFDHRLTSGHQMETAEKEARTVLQCCDVILIDMWAISYQYHVNFFYNLH